VRRKRHARALVAVRPLEQRGDVEHGVVDPGVQVADGGVAGRHGRDREVARVDVVDLVPGDGRGHRPLRVPPHGVRGGDGVVAGVLVVVDEHRGGIPIPPPPGRRRVLGHPPLHLAGERGGRAADLVEAVLGPDAHVDVHPAAAGGLGPAHRAQLVQDLVRDVRDPPHPVERALRHRVEVDAPLVRPLGVCPSAVPRVELHGRHLHRPDDVGELGDAELVGGALVAREEHPHGLHPRRRAHGQPLLVHLLAGDARGVPVHHAGSLAQRVHDAVADR
jgi:hypothetical protein